ncbi:PP2C family serine/threonine-protein phosphatase [Halopseudomonas phragmitis]|uniref:PPM-type phosphatase domain-containing protein n=1 Tax=Halopseudomonas phragmitis TaxID=1931241 RepID=A0A1V0B6K1_9GAMM|nr:PP2C family serine/threonine-protein phosphatase [Halopseudomonas phragmitis]AQZ95572.1 hypothetical protein BVH74_12790 [Halopseudomonas phragmitis]
MRILSAGAAVTGTSHVDNGQPCQDAFEIVASFSGVVACVCDGAGSAARSDEGARALAQGVCRTLSADLERSLTEANAFERIAGAIQSVREQLANRGPLEDFHSTLCGVVMTRQGNLVFHLGDGLIFGINPDDWDDCLVSEPENGEFAETTYFFTLPGWRQHLRVQCVPPRFSTWFLMTDGTASFAARSQPYRPERGFLQPVHNYLSSVTQFTGRQALEGTLADPRTHRITADDKTLVWLHHGS